MAWVLARCSGGTRPCWRSSSAPASRGRCRFNCAPDGLEPVRGSGMRIGLLTRDNSGFNRGMDNLWDHWNKGVSSPTDNNRTHEKNGSGILTASAAPVEGHPSQVRRGRRGRGVSGYAKRSIYLARRFSLRNRTIQADGEDGGSGLGVLVSYGTVDGLPMRRAE